MSFNVDEFKSKFNDVNGFMSPNKFLVLIQPPPWSSDEVDTKNVLPFLCDSTNLPGISFTFSEIKHTNLGPIERKPDVPIYTELPLTFLATGDGRVLKFFHVWMQNIINIGNGKKALTDSPYKGAYSYEVFYSDNYRTTINLLAFNDSGDTIVEYTLLNAFPTTVGDLPMNWATTDDIVRLPITFSFKTWHSTFFEEASFNEQNIRPRNSSVSFLQSLSLAGSAVSTLQSLTSPVGVADAINKLNNAKVATNFLNGLKLF